MRWASDALHARRGQGRQVRQRDGPRARANPEHRWRSPTPSLPGMVIPSGSGSASQAAVVSPCFLRRVHRRRQSRGPRPGPQRGEGSTRRDAFPVACRGAVRWHTRRRAAPGRRVDGAPTVRPRSAFARTGVSASPRSHPLELWAARRRHRAAARDSVHHPPYRRDDSGAAFSGAFPCSVTGHAVPEVVEFLLTSTVFFTGADDVAQLIQGDPRSVTRSLPVVGFGERLAEDVADALGIPARK